ncbi:helix-turn-helix transcriptional regulator [Pseudoalteromonas mariniglutinosa]|uniref:helix-turn-helix transcriptional regulator n=1 Tax=Pseudoalteromonas mariniglutinosa TaxID=206042 RepID=UPI00384EB4B9
MSNDVIEVINCKLNDNPDLAQFHLANNAYQHFIDQQTGVFYRSLAKQADTEQYIGIIYFASPADPLNVSERTIYRDIQHLQSAGVPVEGEAGMGYLIICLPMMLTLEELQALLLGSKMVSAWTDPQLAAITKINAVLPKPLKQQVDTLPYLVCDFNPHTGYQHVTLLLRQAISNKTSFILNYLDANQQSSTRTVDPLGLVYWGGNWPLVAYCQLRQDY